MKDTEIKVNGKCVGEYDMCPDDNRPDWDVNDEDDPRYVKNRLMYIYDHTGITKLLDNYTEVDIVGKQSGYTFRADGDVNSYGGNALAISVMARNLGRYSSEYNIHIKERYFDSNLNREYTSYWDIGNTNYSSYNDVKDVGSGSGILSVNRCVDIREPTNMSQINFRVYFICDPSKLKDEYKTRFDKKGIYIEYVNMPRYVSKYCILSFDCKHIKRLDRYFMQQPDSLAILEQVSKAQSGKVLKINSSGVPEWATVVEVPAFTASDAGKVLSVDSTGTLVWITPPTTTETTETT